MSLKYWKTRNASLFNAITIIIIIIIIVIIIINVQNTDTVIIVANVLVNFWSLLWYLNYIHVYTASSILGRKGCRGKERSPTKIRMDLCWKGTYTAQKQCKCVLQFLLSLNLNFCDWAGSASATSQ